MNLYIFINLWTKWYVCILRCLRLFLSPWMFFCVCLAMEKQSEKIDSCLESSYDSLGLDADMVSNAAYILNKTFVFENVQEHILKYPFVFSQDGLAHGSEFLKDLKGFVESELLLRVNDGVGDVCKNQEYYEHIKEVCIDYSRLLDLSGFRKLPDNESERKLDEFYKAGSSDIFLNYLVRCENQRNACLVIINEIHFLSNKLCSGISDRAESLSDEAIEWSKKHIDSLYNFSKAHSKFLLLCLAERKNFITLLHRLCAFCLLSRKTSENYFEECHGRLSLCSELATKIMIQRERDKTFAKEKYTVKKVISEGSTDNSVKRKSLGGSQDTLLDIPSGSLLRRSSSVNGGFRGSHRLIRKLSFRSDSQKIEKTGSSDLLEKDEKKRGTK